MNKREYDKAVKSHSCYRCLWFECGEIWDRCSRMVAANAMPEPPWGENNCKDFIDIDGVRKDFKKQIPSLKPQEIEQTIQAIQNHVHAKIVYDAVFENLKRYVQETKEEELRK